jgi:hypothetical protein
MVAASVMIVACLTPAQVQTIKTDALTIEQVACVISAAALGPSEPPAVVAACGIAPQLTDLVTQLLAGAKKGLASAAAHKADAGK